MKEEKATLKSIGTSLGLSVATVSRALNGKGKQYRISDKTVALVRREADRVAFTVNKVASALRTKKTYTLGVIIPDNSNDYFSSLVRYLSIEARKLGYSIFLCDSEGDLKLEVDAIELMHSREVDGLIVTPCSAQSDHFINVQKRGLPLVLCDRYFIGVDLPYVGSDNEQGAYLAVKHLIAYGHQHIACLSGKQQTSTTIERLSGYQKALNQQQLTEYIAGDEFAQQSGYEATKLLLVQQPKISALFSMNNQITYGALKACSELHLEIGKDISIVTFDDSELFTLLAIPLTVIEQQKQQIAQQAITLLLQQIDSNSLVKRDIKLPTTIIKRESVQRLN
jgi:LacI family transcriptional regulator